MLGVDVGRRHAIEELREGFWRWDPLGFGPERELLPNEYDDQVERTLEFLEQGADADEIELDLADWLRRQRGGRKAVGANASTAEAADAMVAWWREYQSRPPLPPSDTGFWERRILGVPVPAVLLLAAVLAVVVTNSIVAEGNGPPDAALGIAQGIAVALLVPLALFLGNPRARSTNPQLLAGVLLLTLSELGSTIRFIERLVEPVLFPDLSFDPERIQPFFTALGVIEVGLSVAGMVLVIRGLRRAGAPPAAPVFPIAVIVVALGLTSPLLYLITVGQPFVDAVQADLGWLFSLLLSWPFPIALGVAVAHLVAGTRRGLVPPVAWFVASLGFAAWFLVSVGLGPFFAFSQVVPGVIPLGAVFTALNDTKTVGVVGAFALGLGSGTTPAWLVDVGSWLAARRGAAVSAAGGSSGS